MNANQQYAERWTPQKDAEAPRSIDATVVGVRPVTVDSGYGSRTVIALDLLTADGQTTSLLAVGSVLENEIKQQRPDVGERVILRYSGLRLKKDVEPGSPQAGVPRNSFHHWTVSCPDRPAAGAYDAAYGPRVDERPARAVYETDDVPPDPDEDPGEPPEMLQTSEIPY